MPFKITITDDADRQFTSLPAREQRILEAAVEARLEHQPTDNNLVSFNIIQRTPVACPKRRKAGNKLIVEGEEFHGHQDHPVEPPGNGSQKDAE